MAQAPLQSKAERPQGGAAQHFDVAVFGGGSAGVAAALAAARSGAHTLLVEREEELGGNATRAFVHTICGLYAEAESEGPVPLNPGLPMELAAALRAAGAAGEVERAGRVFVLATYPERIAAVLERSCARERELEVERACHLEDLQLSREVGQVHRFALRRGTERRHCSAALLVDTTGDANAAAAGGAGVRATPPEERQIPSYIFALDEVDTAELEGFERLRVTHAVAGAARSGALPRGCESVLVRPGARTGQAYLTLNLPRSDEFDPFDPASVATQSEQARKNAEELVAHLRRTRDAFRRARVATWPARLGIRESRSIQGEREIDRKHVLSGVRSDDDVALSSWPIELWPDHRRARFAYPEAACGVPFAALISATHPQLAAAGRCLSATHEAHGALRVIGTALATGQAAGAAAALSASSGVALSALAPDAVRRQIRAIGRDADGELEA